MRITDVYLQGVGPFTKRKELVCLHTDDDRVLLTGISGSGKSTALWAMAFLWCLFCGSRDRFPKTRTPEGSMAMHVMDLDQQDWMIVYSADQSFRDDVMHRHPEAKGFSVDPGENLVHTAVPQKDSPNMILLDAEEHFVLPPAKQHEMFFITDDDVGGIWVEMLTQFHQSGYACADRMMEGINRLLVGKKLMFSNDGRLQVCLNGETAHSPQQLSTGERHMILLCFCAACCLKKGGVLLLDEPAVHLHPSQTIGLLSTLEGYCREAGGQMFLVSHNPAIWQRYEVLGLSVELEVDHAGV